MFLGSIFPYAATQIKSGLNFLISLKNSSVLILAGCKTGILCFSARIFVGGGRISSPRPLGLSGWVTTATASSLDSIRALREGTANSGVPMNIILIGDGVYLQTERYSTDCGFLTCGTGMSRLFKDIYG